MMKILHVSRSDTIGGACRAAYRIHSALLNNRVDSKMIVLVKRTQDETIISVEDITNGLKFSNFMEKILNRFLNYSQAEVYSSGLFGQPISEFINKSDANIVHLHWINGGILSLSEILKIKKPILWTVHDLWPLNGLTHYDLDEFIPTGLKTNFLIKLLDNYLIRKKLKIIEDLKIQCIANSKWTANQISKKLKIKIKDVPLLPYPIDLKFWSRNTNIATAKNAIGVNPNKYVIMFGAPNQSEYRKGFDLLKKALSLLPKKIIEKSSIVVFGGNFDEKSLELKNIINLGSIESDNQLKSLYSAADVVVMPSRLETFGQVALEAIACGSPVASFKSSGLIDVISHKKTGYLARPFDMKDLCDGICWCLKKSVSFEDKEWQYNLNKFDYQNLSKRYIKFYKGI